MERLIHPSARKHGVTDDDILHAIEYARVERWRGNRVISLGPDRAANMLEVVTVRQRDGSVVVIHAMKMQPKYERWLRGHGDDDA